MTRWLRAGQSGAGDDGFSAAPALSKPLRSACLRGWARVRSRRGAPRGAKHLTLLCLSRTHGRIHRLGELPVELAGDVALEAAADFPRGLSLGGAPGDVGAGAGAAADAGQCDGVDGAVQGAVRAAVEPVPGCLAAAGGDGAGAAEGGERGLVAAAAGVGEADDGRGGADRPDAVAAGEAGGDVVDDGQQLLAVVLELAPGLAERVCQAKDLSLADSLSRAA